MKNKTKSSDNCIVMNKEYIKDVVELYRTIPIVSQLCAKQENVHKDLPGKRRVTARR